ncbi:MAG: hypothetical protein ACLUN5_09355 [Oscillospiraceae bacterium]
MLEYWLWLTGRRGVGLRGLRALLEQFGTPEAVYCAAEQDYPQALRPEGALRLPIRSLRLRGRSCSSATGRTSMF